MLHTIIAIAVIAVAAILPELWMLEGGGCTARGLLLLGGMESQHVCRVEGIHHGRPFGPLCDFMINPFLLQLPWETVSFIEDICSMYCTLCVILPALSVPWQMVIRDGSPSFQHLFFHVDARFSVGIKNHSLPITGSRL